MSTLEPKEVWGILEPWFLNLGAPESPGGFVETDDRAPPSQFLTQWV